MRWLRRVGVVTAIVIVSVGAVSAAYDFATRRPVDPPAGLSYVRTGSFQTRYDEWGTTGPAVVLVPGFLETADTWRAVANLLSESHRVVSYDVAGFGYTERTGPYGTAAAADQLLALIKALGLIRPMLVGHSAGAAVIAAAALKDPSAVGGLVFVDGDGLTAGAGPPRALTAFLVDPLRTALFRLLVRSDLVIRTVYSQQCGPRCPRLDAAGIQEWRRPLQVRGAIQALWALTRAGGLGLPADQVGRLRDLAVPKRVIFGAGDNVFGATAPQTTAARIGAPAPTVIPNARHLTLISDPGVIATTIASLSW